MPYASVRFWRPHIPACGLPTSIVTIETVFCLLISDGVMPERLAAQEVVEGPRPTLSETGPTLWALAGIDASINDRWQTTVRAGHVGGFDARPVLADLTWTSSEHVKLIVGYIYVQPDAHGTRHTSLTRAGGVWIPARGRMQVENQTLFELVAGGDRPASTRIRNRLRASWAVGGPLNLGAYASAEGFLLASGLSALRYQTGTTWPVGRCIVDVSWLRHTPREGLRFDALALTAMWHVRKH
jgi:hypothetical protein